MEYHRWFLLPMEEDGPKYLPDDRLDGFEVGVPFSRDQLEEAGYGVLLAYNDAEEWPVVEAWGDGYEAWNALNEIHANHHDSDTLADQPDNVLDRIEEIHGEYYQLAYNPEPFIGNLQQQLNESIQNTEPGKPTHEGNISMHEHLQNINQNFPEHANGVVDRRKDSKVSQAKRALSGEEGL